MKIYDNHSLLRHNTFGIDVSCKRFVEYETEEELQEALSRLRECPEEPFLHIGGGSNLLFVDDFHGTILHSGLKGKEKLEDDRCNLLLRVGAAESWDNVVETCIVNGYFGMENLSYIPGETGAAAVQNVGAYGAEAAQFIERVEAVEVTTGKKRVFTRDECRYAYRNSIFKKELRGKYVITHVVFRLSHSFSPDLSYGAIAREMERRGWTDISPRALRNLVIDIRRSKLPDPAVQGSAGSFFMNPVVSEAKFNALQSAYPDMPHYVTGDGVKIPAGWLIEQCGWKGRSLGRAGVFEKQALVLVNLGGATGRDIAALSDAVRRDVKARFGIDLYPEVNFIA